MSSKRKTSPLTVGHGASALPAIEVTSYNLELRDENGFIGDRASKTAFKAIFDKWRGALRKLGCDPLGDANSVDVSKKKLDKLLEEGAPDAGGLILSAIEEFAAELKFVISRFIKDPAWRGTECIVIGGGLSASRVGKLAIARTDILLKTAGIVVRLEVIANDPDEAGLLGTAHLVPAWTLKGFDAMLAVDIGGTNIRAGVLEFSRDKELALEKTKVWKSRIWRHADDEPGRDEAVEELISLLSDLLRDAEKAKLAVAPVIGVGCPGLIKDDGAIETGAQNLPGNWESQRFNLAREIEKGLATIGEHDTTVIIHNDAVVQGLSALPGMRPYRRWAVLTIGTGLGNASFAQRE